MVSLWFYMMHYNTLLDLYYVKIEDNQYQLYLKSQKLLNLHIGQTRFILYNLIFRQFSA